jgi:ribosome-associated protein
VRIKITPEIRIDDRNISYNFVRASGPGGQHVNKSATAVQLRFDVANSSLPDWMRERLAELAGQKLTQDGELIIEAAGQRSQVQNRKEARRRLMDLLRRAAKRPKQRKKTKPPRSVDERRLQDKHHRSRIKELRKPPPERRY